MQHEIFLPNQQHGAVEQTINVAQPAAWLKPTRHARANCMAMSGYDYEYEPVMKRQRRRD